MTSASTMVNNTALISFTILGSLYLFQRAKRKRWQNQNDEVIIDLTVSLSE